MRRVVDSLNPHTPGFSVMIRYAMGWVTENDEPYHQPTGKRIRPMLLLLCAETAGGNWQMALPAAAAVELLHNFSLIHDDIQDNSPTRHSRPTVWKIWGTANAINAGDAMFGLSYYALETLSQNGVPAETVIQVWRIFNETVFELTRGQHLDMRFEQQPNVTVDDYLSMISGKSAALVSACAHMGALIATGDAALARLYAEFGLNIGIAFQIRDDILGIWGDSRITGKSAATDILSRKKSLPVLYGLSQSDSLKAIYRKTNLTDEDVAEAVRLLDSVDAQSFVHQQESDYYERAMEALSQTNPPPQVAEGLRKFTDTLFQRTY
jgi:geranylgeranyl diphosphate synthase type I